MASPTSAGACQRSVLIAVLVVAGLLGSTLPAAAQRGAPPGDVGVGAQVGRPTGLTLKRYIRPDAAMDLLVSWSFDRSWLLNTHVSYEYLIPDSPLGFFTGPGLLFGRRHASNDADWEFAATALAGLNYFTQQFEVFLQTRPTLTLAPTRRLGLGGSVGIRYFF